MHPFKPAVQHIDFQAVELNTPVKVKVPVHLINSEVSPAVKLQGGRVAKLMANIEIITLPGNIPEFLELDMSKVTGGQILHISDVNMPEGCESVSLRRNEDLAIASVTGKKR
jgi:large subunit ribosomal protein L25